MQYRILGPFSVARDGVEIVVGSGKQRALLALLLLHANEAVSTDQADRPPLGRDADDEFDEGSPERTSRSLRRLARRRRLDHPRARLRAPGRAGRARSSTASTTRSPTGGRRWPPAILHAAAAILGEALALWHGPPLDRLRLRAVRAGGDRAPRRAPAGGADRADRRRPPARPSRRPDRRAGDPRRPAIRSRNGCAASSCSRSTAPGARPRRFRSTRRPGGCSSTSSGSSRARSSSSLEQRDPRPRSLARTAARSRRALLPRRPERSGRGRVSWSRLSCLRSRSRSRGSWSSVGAASKPIAAVPPTAVIGVIDPKTNKLAGAVPVDNLPTRVAADNEQVWALSSVRRNDVEDRPEIAGGGARSYAVQSLSRDHLSSIALDGGLRVGRLQRHPGCGRGLRCTSQGSPSSGTPMETVADVAAGGDSIWVTSQRRHAVIQVDPATLRVVARVPVPAVPLAVAACRQDGLGRRLRQVVEGRRVCCGSIPRTTRSPAAIPLPGIPGDVAVGYGGVWATVNSEDAVWRIDPATGSVVRTIPVGSGPVAIAVGEGAVWVASAKDATVSRIDPATNKVVATIPVGGSPRDVAVGGGRIWVAGLSSA